MPPRTKPEEHKALPNGVYGAESVVETPRLGRGVHTILKSANI